LLSFWPTELVQNRNLYKFIIKRQNTPSKTLTHPKPWPTTPHGSLRTFFLLIRVRYAKNYWFCCFLLLSYVCTETSTSHLAQDSASELPSFKQKFTTKNVIQRNIRLVQSLTSGANGPNGAVKGLKVGGAKSPTAVNSQPLYMTKKVTSNNRNSSSQTLPPRGQLCGKGVSPPGSLRSLRVFKKHHGVAVCFNLFQERGRNID